MTARGNLSTKSPLTRSLLHTDKYDRTTTRSINKPGHSFQTGGFTLLPDLEKSLWTPPRNKRDTHRINPDMGTPTKNKHRPLVTLVSFLFWEGGSKSPPQEANGAGWCGLPHAPGMQSHPMWPYYQLSAACHFLSNTHNIQEIRPTQHANVVWIRLAGTGACGIQRAVWVMLHLRFFGKLELV